jgi:23S rRNA (uracil1939-C5)-methyltransferase
VVPGGDGFARLSDGRPGFASGALPGDRIEVVELDERNRYVRARRWRLAEAGADRVIPPCPIAERCGGCDWMALARPAQLLHKEHLLDEALRRTGRLHGLSPRVVSIGPDLGYRTRLRLHLDPNGRIGLFGRGTHELVELSACAVSASDVNRGLSLLRVLLQRKPELGTLFSELEIRAAPAGPPLSLRLFPRERMPTLSERHTIETALGQAFAIDIAGEARGPTEPQRWPLPGGVELEAPTGAFTQVNWAVNTAMVEALLAGARSRGVRRFCDLYCGAGNFALALAADGIPGLGVERSIPAVDAARRAATRAGLTHLKLTAGDAKAAIEELAERESEFDLVIVDPPRAGARELVDALARLRPNYVAYCSCDPVTLARDLRLLVDRGYEVDAIEGFDMFPHTHHVEALAWLIRGRGAEAAPSAR